VALTEDDIEQGTLIFREYMEILKALFKNYDLTPFLNPETDPATRYTLLAKAAEFVFSSNENFNSVSKDGKKTKKVTFKTYFLQNVKRMRKAYDLCQPSGELSEDESALAQCFMAIAGMVYKMNGTDAPDTDTMNRRVAKMVEEALKYNNVESILEEGEEMDIFGPEFTERLEDIKMPASKLETLIKLLRKQITEYGKTNQVASKKFQEMLEATIQEYHDRRKFLSEQEAGATQEATAESIIKNATEQALNILKGMQADRESFRKLGLTFEEKAFYDILIHLRDKNNFEYGEDKEVDGIVVNDKCKSLACKIRDIIDAKSSFADWLNNQRVRDQLKQDIKICLVKNGYPPQYTPEVFREVMEQVENFKENEDVDYNEVKATPAPVISMYAPIEEEGEMMTAAEPFECYKWNHFDKNIIDFFGGDKTILVGCAKNKKQKDWILAHNIYNVRLGKTKGSMEEHRKMFGRTSLLVLYEFGKLNKLSAYAIKGHKEMGKEELKAMDYPNKNPRKSYMTFSIKPLDIDLSLLANHRMIEKLIELNPENEKGTPVFIEP
jgi:type I restriction enzyme R subunit